MEHIGLPADTILSLRQQHVAGSCQLHFLRSPVKIVRSLNQYLYDDGGVKYLDCASRTTAVGHCHPSTVQAARCQLSTLSFCLEGLGPGADAGLHEMYSRKILQTLPDTFDVCLFTHSGGEANDLALQLARKFTGKEGVAVVEGAFHGGVGSVVDISPKVFRRLRGGQKPWVHVIPAPDPFHESFAGEDIAEKYYKTAVNVLEAAKDNGEVGCFISEPLFVVHGVLLPPRGWLKKIYRYVREAGGLVICDEIQTGLGRCGTKFWCHQHEDCLGGALAPDIITAGKPIGNGHPVGMVVTSRRIAAVLSQEELFKFRCGPVAAVVGSAVLQVLEDEGLMARADAMGRYFQRELRDLQRRQEHIGAVRGLGLIIGVEVVQGGEQRQPCAELAEDLCYRLKEERILVATEGVSNNVLVFMPPFCITKSDVDSIVCLLDKVLTDVTLERSLTSYILSSSGSWMNENRAGSSDSSSNNENVIDYDSLD